MFQSMLSRVVSVCNGSEETKIDRIHVRVTNWSIIDLDDAQTAHVP